jgi:cytochrome c biogenesis protein CcmG/thiol:disulfide interchange protein DsbE
MTYRKKSKFKQRSPAPLVLVGAGLIFIALTITLIMMPDATGSAGGPASSRDSAIPPARIDYPAPALSLKDLDGNATSLEDYQGQVILINNWATWCPPCRAEMPELEAYYQAHQDDGFTLIGINAAEPAEAVEAFVRKNSISFPMWLDPTSQALSAFQNNGLPSSYVLDRSAKVRLAWTGAINTNTLEEYVTPLLEE